MQKGDLVLVPFPFTDLSSTKRRPALVFVTTDDVTLSFITTKLHWQEKWDILLNPTKENGLKKKSLLRLAKITTLEKSLIIGKLGRISLEKHDELNSQLELLFKLK